MHRLAKLVVVATMWFVVAGVGTSCGGGSDNAPASKTASSSTKSSKELLLGRIRAGFAAADAGNAATNTPLSPPPQWLPNTVYRPGQVVRGTGADAQNQYICKQASGASLSTGSGPSGTPDTPITDGGVIWYYAGPVRATSVDPLMPAISSGTKQSLLVDLNNYQTIHPTLNSPSAFFAGGVVETNSALGGAIAVRGSNYSTAAAPLYSGANASMTFWTDSPTVVLASYGPIYADVGLVLEINDRLIDDSQYLAPSLANPGAYRLDFTGPSATARKKIRVMSMGGFGYVAHEIFIASGSRLWTQANSSHWKMAVEGDSLTQGGYGTPYHVGLDWVSQVGRLIGCDDVANMAQGGTGFINNVNGTKTTYIERVDRLASLNADVYLIAGNHNDLGYADQAQVAAALAYFRKLRALQPSALIVVAGTNPLQSESGSAGAVRAGELNLKAAFDQWADSNSYFLPIATAPDGPWITGMGAVDNPKGDGNKDRFYITADGHPLQRGVDYFAQRYAQALRKIFLGS